eukprot:TRINITY_DN5204_c0_g1_i1.p1 TRINITY_DN5204_c0_g1~~TRINITY_DN5204_c0_g1_i1.p1  ORF type:complete len:625 (-),score=182.00 TRINITY_DN5204_c0_g1_i1:115-1989(-)
MSLLFLSSLTKWRGESNHFHRFRVETKMSNNRDSFRLGMGDNRHRLMSNHIEKNNDKKTTSGKSQMLKYMKDDHSRKEIVRKLESKNETMTKLVQSELKGNVMDLSLDKNGSFVIQSCLRHFSEESLPIIWNEIMDKEENFDQLLNHNLGNCIIQTMTERNPKLLKDRLVPISMTKGGSICLQKMVEKNYDDINSLLQTELEGSVNILSKNPFAIFVLISLVKASPKDRVEFIWKEVFEEKLFNELVHDSVGSLLIQSMMEKDLQSFSGRISEISKTSGGVIKLQRILESNKEEKYSDFILEQIQGKVIELSTHQQAHFLIRFLVERYPKKRHLMIWEEINADRMKLKANVFGKYILDSMNKKDLLEDQAVLQNNFESHVGNLVNFSKTKEGSWYLHNILIENDDSKIRRICKELKGNVLDLCSDRHGSWVLQACIKYLGEDNSQFIWKEILGSDVLKLAFEENSSYVISTMIDKDILSFTTILSEIAKTKTGNMALINALEKKNPEINQLICSELRGKVVDLIKNEYACFVIQWCINNLPREQNQFIWDEILNYEKFSSLFNIRSSSFTLKEMLLKDIFSFSGKIKDISKMPTGKPIIVKLSNGKDQKIIKFLDEEFSRARQE